MYFSVCGGWVSCRKVACWLNGNVESCRRVDYYLKCENGVMSVRTGLFLAMRGDAEVRTSRRELFCLCFYGRGELDSGCAG